MSGLFATLNTTVKALSVHSRSLETAGKNLANVNNPAYARQRVIIGDRGSVLTPQGVESLGLEVLGLQQMRDTLADAQVLREISLSHSATSEQTGLQRAQTALGQSIDRTASASDPSSALDRGVGGAIDDFFSAFSSFAASPTDTGARQNLMQKAATLTDRFQLTDRRLATVQGDLNTGIANDVATANSLLANIANLNSEIGQLETNNPGAALDLRDQRQAKLEQLAAIIPIEVRPGTGGQVQVVSLNGSGADVPLVTLGVVQGTVAFTGTTITAGSPATVLALGSGSIKGELTARDGGIKTIRDSLDALASQLVTSVNAAYNPTAIAGGNFFVAAGTTAAALTVTSTITAANVKASNGGPVGDNTTALAVAQLANQSFATSGGAAINGTYSDFFALSVAQLGQDLSDANATVDSQTSIETLVRAQRDSSSGVNLDEEMADLLKFQRAFQASSRVFNVVDSLLDEIVNRLGR